MIVFFSVTKALMAAALLFGAGCTKVVQRAVNEIKGAESRALPVPGLNMANFQLFQRVTIAPPRTELGGLVSTQYLDILPVCLRTSFGVQTNASLSGTGTLNIEPVVMWYHRGGVCDALPVKFVVTLFYLSLDGRELGRVQVFTRSKAAGKGDEDLANSAAEALTSFLKRDSNSQKTR